MLDISTGHFVKTALGDISSRWIPDEVRKLAALSVPSGLAGSAEWLLTADYSLLLARWFLEGVCDPARYRRRRGGQFPQLYSSVRQSVSRMASGIPPDEQMALAKGLAAVLLAEIQRERAVRRTIYDRELCLQLWERYPRCWICGALFPDWARATFLKESVAFPRSSPRFVDFFRPRGLRPEDQQVEIEHVVALASGGEDVELNLRLACRWCNQAKGARTVLFDTGGQPQTLFHPELGHEVGVPRPFWVVRLLAMRPRCEWSGGCDARPNNAELTVAPIREQGSPNPANLQVTCYAHDPIKTIRLVSTSRIRRRPSSEN